MPQVSKVSIFEFISASKRYAGERFKKADLNGDGTLSSAEAKKLPKDLQDNVAVFRAAAGSKPLRVKGLASKFADSVEVWSKHAEKNGDGALSAAEAKALPTELQDNFQNFRSALSRTQKKVSGLTTRDATPKGLVAKHLKKFGSSPISYDKAFALALKEAFASQEGPRGFVEEAGSPDGSPWSSKAKVDAVMKKLLADGSLELIGTNESIPTGEEVQDNWIFRIDVGDEYTGDNGLWAIVDRQTGDSSVTSFN